MNARQSLFRPFLIYSLSPQDEVSMTLQTGIFGYPIAHSISPAMHQAALDHAGIDATYHAWETPPDALAQGVSMLRGDDYLGANVTVPHKQAVMEHVDEIDELATRIGAVNTIVNDDGRLLGSNTDAAGFIDSLRDESGLAPSGLDAVLIGAGGAARAAAFALAMEAAASLTIANRTLERALALADEVCRVGLETCAVALDDSELRDRCLGANLIVNSSSVGMLHGPAEGSSPVPIEFIRPGVLVYDMVYNPADTPLLKISRSGGARVAGGLLMLVYQGAASFRQWTGQNASTTVMLEAARRALFDMNSPKKELTR